MNYIGYDAMTFGNHEFDKGLPALRTFINEAKFPFISSNIDFTSKDNELKDIFVNQMAAPLPHQHWTATFILRSLRMCMVKKSAYSDLPLRTP